MFLMMLSSLAVPRCVRSDKLSQKESELDSKDLEFQQLKNSLSDALVKDVVYEIACSLLTEFASSIPVPFEENGFTGLGAERESRPPRTRQKNS